jgi:hypothetical protein
VLDRRLNGTAEKTNAEEVYSEVQEQNTNQEANDKARRVKDSPSDQVQDKKKAQMKAGVITCEEKQVPAPESVVIGKWLGGEVAYRAEFIWSVHCLWTVAISWISYMLTFAHSGGL